MTCHLGHEKHGRVSNTAGNTRNGTSRKNLKGKTGEVSVAIPRDRDGSFTPHWWKNTRRTGRGLMIKLSRSTARGMNVREIQGHLGSCPHRCFSGPDKRGNECGSRGCAPVARPSSGCGLSDSLPELPSCKGARLRLGQHQGGLSRLGCYHERGERTAWHVDIPE